MSNMQNPGSPDDQLRIYGLYRDYVMQESSLINARLMWILTINGFLFTTYGLCAQKELEIAASDKFDSAAKSMASHLQEALGQLEVLLIALALAGIIISLLGWVSVRAAQVASTRVAARYDLMRGNPITSWRIDLPDLRGGGSRNAVFYAHQSSQIIPIVFALVWVVLCASSFDAAYYVNDILKMRFK